MSASINRRYNKALGTCTFEASFCLAFKDLCGLAQTVSLMFNLESHVKALDFQLKYLMWSLESASISHCDAMYKDDDEFRSLLMKHYTLFHEFRSWFIQACMWSLKKSWTWSLVQALNACRSHTIEGDTAYWSLVDYS